MRTVRYEHGHLDLACELALAERGERATEWRRLRDTASLGAEPISGGARLHLRPEAWDTAVDLCRREAECCRFLDLELAADQDGMRLDVTSPVPEAAHVIASLVGLQPDGEVECC
jgi:hypothetical protein